MEFIEVIKKRRSVRLYTDKAISPDVINNALDAALLAPNSSNMQLWEFYWVQNPDKKAKLIEACLSQSAAKSAKELIVAVASLKNWKANSQKMAQRLKQNKSPQKAIDYYEKLMPVMYGKRYLAPFKWLIFNFVGFFRPMVRGPIGLKSIQEVVIKSTALACENFMLSIADQGYDTCPMEGFDEKRVKKILNIKCKDRVVMVISVGERHPDGIWGEQIRFPRELFIHEIK